jgi:hypothetical protein
VGTIGRLLKRLGLRRSRPGRCIVNSFPKCGRTWLRYMLGVYILGLMGQDATAQPVIKVLTANGRKAAPQANRVRFVHLDAPHWKKPAELSPASIPSKAGAVVYLTRDPRDVVVSFYHEQTKRLLPDEVRRLRGRAALQAYRERIAPFVGGIDEFARREFGALPTILRYNEIWQDFAAAHPRGLVLRYEELHADTAGTLARMLAHTNTPRHDDLLARAVELGRFENMHNAEAGNREGFMLAPGNPDDPSSYKTRRGAVGGFRDELSPETIAWANQLMRESSVDYSMYLGEDAR